MTRLAIIASIEASRALQGNSFRALKLIYFAIRRNTLAHCCRRGGTGRRARLKIPLLSIFYRFISSLTIAAIPLILLAKSDFQRSSLRVSLALRKRHDSSTKTSTNGFCKSLNTKKTLADKSLILLPATKNADHPVLLELPENRDQTSQSPFCETWLRLRLCARSVALKISPTQRKTFSQLA
jgi:hypothetical protein